VREIVLDTETTGLDPHAGHRIVEVAGVELMNHVATGRTYQVYVDPQRDVPEEAFRVHGLDRSFLSQHPTFDRLVEGMLDFLGDARLVIHNAEFDLKFLNAELVRLGRPKLVNDAVDTVQMARQRFPGAQANLDALCKRFEIDNSARDLHGALLDCQLLAEVYLELRGGRQPGFELAARGGAADTGASQAVAREKPYRAPRPHAPSDAELERHAAMLEKLKSPIWHG
jgi:DNA polymerase-3 subunit epsilon